MLKATAHSLARRLAGTPEGSAAHAGITAALETAGFTGIAPDAPEGFIARACSDARAWNPAYLSTAELSAWQAAVESVLDGHPF